MSDMPTQTFIDFLKTQTIEEIARAMIELQKTVDRITADQPAQQEPVAWLDPEGDDDCKVITASWKRKLQAMSTQLEQEHAAKHTVPVHTTPTQRKPLGYAGITIWGGDATVTKVFTETQMKFAREPRSLIEAVVGQCLDELAAHNIKGDA